MRLTFRMVSTSIAILSGSRTTVSLSVTAVVPRDA
jgi:hypothetical protein